MGKIRQESCPKKDTSTFFIGDDHAMVTPIMLLFEEGA
jgi:hypothetical protein